MQLIVKNTIRRDDNNYDNNIFLIIMNKHYDGAFLRIFTKQNINRSHTIYVSYY